MMRAGIAVGVFVLLLLALYSGSTFGSAIPHSETEENGLRFNALYVQHDPVRINSNEDFALQNWPGNGTADDPYVISGLEIDAHGAGIAIFIGNTTVHFIIENCLLYNTSYHSWPYNGGAGITLHNVTNGTVQNNIVIDNEKQGIRLRYSSHITVRDNYIARSKRGMVVEYSHYNNVINNTIVNCSYPDYDVYGLRLYEANFNNITKNRIINSTSYGLGLYSSDHNNILDNYIANSPEDGIYLEYDNHNNTVINNTVRNSDFNGIYLRDSSTYNLVAFNRFIDNYIGIAAYNPHNTILNNTIINSTFGILVTDSGYYSKIVNNSLHNCGIVLLYDRYILDTVVIENNTVNGKPVYFFRNVSNIDVPEDAGEIILYNVTNVKIRAVVLSNSTDGMEVFYSDNVSVIDSKIADNRRHGILFVSVRNSTIAGNSILNNSQYGVLLDSYSSNNVVYSNDFMYNHGGGGSYSTSTIQAYDSGSSNHWDFNGRGNYWHDWAMNNDSNDQDGDGFVDWSYRIDGYAGAEDEKPLKDPVNPLIHIVAHSGSGFVNITWNAPAYHNGTIAEYRIYRNGAFITGVPASQLWYNDTNVVNGQTYFYQVVAITSANDRVESEVVEASPSAQIPEIGILAPMVLSIIAVLLARRKWSKDLD